MLTIKNGCITGPYVEVLEYFFREYANDILDACYQYFDPLSQDYDGAAIIREQEKRLEALLEELKKESEKYELLDGCLDEL